MKLYYILALFTLLTVAFAADVTRDLLNSQLNSAESKVRDKRALLLGKAALLGGTALLGKKALIVGGAALGAKALYAAKYHGGGGYYHGYGNYGYGGHGGYGYGGHGYGYGGHGYGYGGHWYPSVTYSHGGSYWG